MLGWGVLPYEHEHTRDETMMRLRRNRDVVLRRQRRFREHIERRYGRHERHEADWRTGG